MCLITCLRMIDNFFGTTDKNDIFICGDFNSVFLLFKSV